MRSNRLEGVHGIARMRPAAPGSSVTGRCPLGPRHFLMWNYVFMWPVVITAMAKKHLVTNNQYQYSYRHNAERMLRFGTAEGQRSCKCNQYRKFGFDHFGFCGTTIRLFLLLLATPCIRKHSASGPESSERSCWEESIPGSLLSESRAYSTPKRALN